MTRAACALCLAACGMIVSAQAPRFLAPTDFHTNFAPNPGAAPTSGSRDGWESFPLTQETGYEPSLQPITVRGESILTREQAPTQDGAFQLGFVRRVRLLSGDHPTLRFRLRAPYLAQPTTAHLHIYRNAADEQHTFTLNSSDWQTLSTTLDASPTPITAIAISVDFPHAIHTRSERVELTDLHFAALATKHIDLSQPAALWDATRELFYLQRSLAPGETLTLTAPGATRWTLTAPDHTEAAHGAGASIRHTLGATTQPGIYTLHIESADAESTVLLLVRPTHPRGLIFDAAPTISPQLLSLIRERKAQLEKIATPDAGRNIAAMSTEWLLPGLPSYFNEILQPSELALVDAMLFRATGDPAALDQARMLLRTMATWPTWMHPWFAAHGYHSYYPGGLMTRNIVMAAEFLGSDLTATERTTLDRALMKLSVVPIYEEYVHEDRLQFNYSNWIGNTVSGALLAALASDDPNAGGYALGLFVKERDHVLATYTADNTYGEGISYHRFDLEGTALAAAAAKRLLGVSLDNVLLHPERYFRYSAYSATNLLDYGDSHVDLKPSNVFAYIAALNQSPLTTDYYFRYRDEGTTQLLPRVLWEAQIKPVAGPDPGPASTLFADRGIVAMRDSWQTDATVLTMRAGRNYNHNHADQGSLFYASHGFVWLDEAGYADYYKDLNYNSYNTQAIGHNVLLVDHNSESQVLPGNDVLGAAPRFLHTSLSTQADIAQADLTSAYPSLTRYTRTLIRLAGGPTLVVDDIHSASPRIFSTLWHPNSDASVASTGTNDLDLSHEGDSLSLHTFADVAINLSLHDTPFPLSAYERSERGTVHIAPYAEFSTLHPATSALIVTAITPKNADSEPIWEADGTAYSLTAKGWTLHFKLGAHNTLSITATTPDGKPLELLR